MRTCKGQVGEFQRCYGFPYFFWLASSLFAREENGGLVKRQDNRFSSYECGFESRSRHLNMITSVKKEFSILLRHMVIS